jgi:HlyD family secretion protein
MNKKLVYAVLSVVVLVIVLLGGKKAGWWGGEEAIEVAFEEVSKRRIIETVSASGQIQSEVEVAISPDIPGEIIKLTVIEGDKVKRGDLLVKIDPQLQKTNVERLEASLNTVKANLANTRSRLAQSRAQYENSEASFNRTKDLFEKNVVSQAEFDAANSQYIVSENEVEAAEQSVRASEFNVESSEAGLREAQKNLNRTEIYSPVDGTVSKLNFEAGERVVGTSQMAGSEIMVISDLQEMEVVVDVNENDIIRVGLGDSCEIEVDAYLNRKFKGIVTSIANSAMSQGMSTDQVTNFEVVVRILRASYADLENEKQPGLSPFRPGMSASVEIQTKKVDDVVAVPIQSVTTREIEKEETDEDGEKRRKWKKVKRAGKTDGPVEEVVFVIDGSTVKQVAVKTGIQDNLFIEVLEGLSLEDVVVKAPYSAISKELEDGAMVTEVDEEDLFQSEE